MKEGDLVREKNGCCRRQGKIMKIVHLYFTPRGLSEIRNINPAIDTHVPYHFNMLVIRTKGDGHLYIAEDRVEPCPA